MWEGKHAEKTATAPLTYVACTPRQPPRLQALCGTSGSSGLAQGLPGWLGCGHCTVPAWLWAPGSSGFSPWHSPTAHGKLWVLPAGSTQSSKSIPEPGMVESCPSLSLMLTLALLLQAVLISLHGLGLLHQTRGRLAGTGFFGLF